ncbi:adenosine deaminase [Pseudofrankia inefficax]|uniref:Adenosine deaminase n=1 Tax=Pseudofrankia inefficax (strain DSM 45817 / CECT 9037 / DDB 130130 / EuI1c) TaxID=298654 RepID=E3J4G3_PSEI1|nr:adenosine deaminase [Pseudofrankia inefficax]ADP83082.1 adenosine deaminase [Pseudofrankia inefficax]
MTLETAGPAIDETLVRALPKAEVHVHLEGCFDLADLLELARAADEPLPGPAATLFDVDTHDVPGGAPGALSAFLRFLDWEGGLVRTPEQAARAAYRFAARESASGVRYADVIINPTHWGAWHGRLGALFAAFAAGLDEAEQDGLCVVNLCASLLRQQSPAEAAELVDWIVEARPPRLVALSIDGDERAAGRTGPRFAEAFGRAADAGLRRTVHAGESSGPQGVWDALDLLRAERIDHGVRAAEDPTLLRRLADSQVPLGVCPRSNLALGLYPDRASHPLPALRAAGVAVTVNTDDPAAMGYRLESEWVACADAYGWGLADLAGLARASIAASFAPPELQAALLADVDRFVAGRTRS